MNTMDKVNQILADIEALPAEYKPLVQKEATAIQENWDIAASGALIAGAALAAAHWWLILGVVTIAAVAAVAVPRLVTRK